MINKHFSSPMIRIIIVVDYQRYQMVNARWSSGGAPISRHFFNMNCRVIFVVNESLIAEIEHFQFF